MGRIEKTKPCNLLQRLSDYENNMLKFMENEQQTYSDRPGETIFGKPNAQSLRIQACCLFSLQCKHRPDGSCPDHPVRP